MPNRAPCNMFEFCFGAAQLLVIAIYWTCTEYGETVHPGLTTDVDVNDMV
jgi:hypothetical protein